MPKIDPKKVVIDDDKKEKPLKAPPKGGFPFAAKKSKPKIDPSKIKGL